MRASDADRQRVIDTLQEHTAAGRLTLDEFSDRVGAVYAAKTLDELRTAIVDLPARARTAPAEQADTDSARHLAIAFVVALLAIMLLGVVYRLVAG